MNMRTHIAGMAAERSPFRLKPLAHSVQRALLPGLVATLASAPLAAAPTGGQVRAGNAHISHDAAHGVTIIKQTSARTAIDWQSFNVAKGEQVRFNQPDAKATALNRIFDQKPSEIFGQVKANGRVVLMNPNGVFFRPGAQVSVGGLIAGAMRVGVDEFMSGRYQLKGEDGSDGRVVNQGSIVAAPGGDVALVGKSVANEGVIMATAGRVSLLAGEQTTVDFDGDGLLRFKVDKAVVDNAAKLDEQVANSGEISADGGQIMITARAAAGVFDKAINNAGVIKAGRIDKRGGKIMLVGTGAGSSVLNTGSIDASAATVSDDGGEVAIRGDQVENRGRLEADATDGRGGSIAIEGAAKATFEQGSTMSATSARGKGGSVQASAEQLAFNFDAAVDVSGRSGGGEALLGGDLHGEGAKLTNARQVFVGSDATIKADATGKGKGGKVVVWSDDATRFYGHISARGGVRGGDGGMVEVSGKQHLSFAGAADTRAPFGELGTLLLDPAVLHIRDTGGAGQEDGFLPSVDEADDSAGAGQVDSVTWSAINALGASANVALTATGDVTIENMSGNTTTLTIAAGGSLSVTSVSGNILFNSTGDTLKTSGGAVTFNTLAGTMTLGNFDTTVSGGNGALTFNSAGDVVFGNIKTGGAALTVNVASGKFASQRAATTLQGSTALIKSGAGTLTLNQSNSYVGATTINAGVLAVTLADALGGSGGASGTTVNTGGVLDINNVVIADEPIRLGGGTLRGSGAAPGVDSDIALTADSIIDVPGTDLILNGQISGAGFGIDKQGVGRLTLNQQNIYTGTTTITAGSIFAGVDNVFQSSVLNIAGAAARFEMETTNQTIAGLAGSGVVSNDEPGTNLVTLTINGGNGQTFNGTFFDAASDDISVVKTGTGTQTFGVGGTTYAGTLTISAGTLSITTANSLGDASNDTEVSGTGTLNLDNLALASTEVIDISGSGIANVGALTATGSSSIAATNTLTMGANATIGGSGSLTLNTVLDNGGSRALTKTGSGTLVLATDNSADFTGASGDITVNAGVLKITDAGGLGDALGDTTIANDAQLEFALGANAVIGENLAFEGNGGASAALLHSSANTLTLNGTLTLTNVGATNDATISVSNAAGLLKVGAITDGALSLTLTKIGSGTLRMTAAQDYNGVTHVNDGNLEAGVANVLGSSAGLDLGATGIFNLAGFDQSVAKLDGVAGAVVTNDVGSTADIATLTISGGGGSYAGDITENGTDTLSLVKSGTGTQSLSVASGTFDGTTSITGGTLSIITAASLGSNSGDTTANGGTLELNAASLSGSETIHLTGTGNGGIGALTGTGTSSIDSGNSVVLDGDATIGGAGTLTVGAVISESGGARALTKAGNGTLVLAGNNSYTGATTIAAGTVKAGAVDVLDNSSGINLSVSGARLDLAGFNQSIKKLDGVAGTVVTNDVGSVADVATLDITAGGGSFAGNLTQNGSDALTLSKSGTGTQILSGTGSTYSGNTIVSGGTLKAGANNVLGVGDLNLSASGATFNLAGFDQSVDEFDGVAGAVLTNDAGSTGDVATFTVTGGGTYAGDITENGTDTLSLSKTTGGILTLSVGTGSFDGAINITGGALAISTAASLGTATAGTIVNGGTLTLLALNLASSETLSLSGNGGGSGALQANAGVSSIAASNVITMAGDATIASVGVLTINGAIGESGGARSLIKSGAGQLTLAGNNTYSGATTVSDGTLIAGAADVFDNSSGINLSVAGASLNLAGFNQSIASLSGTGIVTNDDSIGASNAAATLTIAGNGGSFSGTITESADDVLSLTKSGVGTQVLASTNTYSGLTTVSGGTLTAGAADILVNSAGLSISASGATFNMAGFDQSITAVSGVAGGILTNNSAAANDTATLTITGNGGSYAGNISQSADDALSFTKAGSGTQILSGTNTYTGATTVNAGTLEAGANNILGTTSGLTLNGAGSTFNLAGFDQQVGKLDGAAGTIVTNNAGNTGDAATLTITGGGGSFSGDITETGSDTLSIIKSGTGTQTLAVVTGSYDGATTVSGGTLLINTAASLGTASGQTTASTGTLDLGGLALASSETINLTGTGAGGAGALTGTASVGAGNGIALTGTGAIGTTATLTINSVISGSGSLSKVGAGNLVLAGNNSYSGSTTVSAGTLTAGAANVLDNSSGVGVAAGATLNLAGFNQTLTKLDGVAGSVVTNDAGGLGDTATLTINGGGGSYAGNITQNAADDLSITKSGTGAQSFAVVSGTFAGATLISGGTLSISTAASLGATASGTAANGGTLDLNGLNLNNAEAISLAGTGNGGIGALTGTGTSSIGNGLTLTGDASVGGTGTLTINTAIGESGGARSLTKTGAGKVVLANAGNTYSGATNVAQGTLEAGAADVLDNSTGLNLTASGATFNLAGHDQSIAQLDGVAGSAVTNNSAAANDVATLTLTGGGGSYAGDLTETGGDTLSLTKSGTGTQSLNVGTGTYNGATLVSGGTLRVASTASLGTASGATTANGGTLDAAFTGSSAEALVLNGSGDGGAGALKGSNSATFSGTISLATATTINVDNGAAGNIDFTLSGAVSGAPASTLTKIGPDTLVLAGNNSYTGATQIDAGVLKLGAATAVSGANVVTLAAGASFDVNDLSVTLDSLGGGAGTVDLGLGSLATVNDLDLSGMTVTIAATGSANQTLRAGTDGSGTLTLDSVTKASTGNLTLQGATLIDLNGDVTVNAGNLSVNDDFNLAGDLRASGNLTLGGAGTLDGAASQTIDAQGGTLTTGVLTKAVGSAGDLTLGGGTAINAGGAVDVQDAGGDLIIADDITTASTLRGARNVIFQGTGTSTFNATGAQTITAGTGVIRDTAGAVLAKSGGANLVLDGGTGIGVSAGNAMGVALGGGSALEVVSGGDVFVTSAATLTVAALDTGAGADTVDIRTSGASATLTMAGPYTDVATDSFILVAARDLNFTTSTLTVSTLDASFGQSGTSSDFDVDQLVSATTPGGFTLTGGGGTNDRIDAGNLAVDLTFTSSSANAGSVSGGMGIDSFTAIESVVGGSGNDTLAGSGIYTVTGGDSGTASLLGGSWSNIENLAGSASSNTFNLAAGGSLSGSIDGLGGTDTVSYASRATAITIDLDSLSAPDIASFANIESFVGGSGTGDVVIGSNHASNWLVTGANAGTIDDTTVGAPNSVEFNFAGFETLQGGTGADRVTIAAGGTISGTVDGGGGSDTLAYLTRGSAVTVNLQNGTAADGSSTFASFSGFENFTGSAAASDKLVGRNRKSDWSLTGSGAGSIDDTPLGAPDGVAEFSFTAFETLQGGSGVDSFTAATGAALTFTQLAGGAGNDVFTVVANGANSPTTLSANILGEADNDTMVFGVHENSPQLSTDPGENSRLIGNLNLGTGIDTLDYSGSALILVNAVTDNDSGSGQAGTVRAAAIASPPNNLPLVSGTYFDVDAVIGNGTQLQGADTETVWIITGGGRGRYGATLATATTTFENFSIRGGNQRDIFIFKKEGVSNVTPQLAVGIDGGDFVVGNAATHNFILGSSGADTFNVTGANALSITIAGTNGAPNATTTAININHIGDAGLAPTTGFADTGADAVIVQAGKTWNGNVLTNGGNDTLTLGAGARIGGDANLGSGDDVVSFGAGAQVVDSLNLGTGGDAVDLSAFTSAITVRVTSATAAGMSGSESSFAGDFAGVETLELGAGDDSVTLTAAPSGAVNTINMGAGAGDALKSLVDATWILSGDGEGALRAVPGADTDQVVFSGVEDLATSGRGVFGVSAGPASVAGNVTAATLRFAQTSVELGNLGLRVVGDIVNPGALTLTASGAGDISVNGDVTVSGAFASKVVNGRASFNNVTTTGAEQSYDGDTLVRGNLAGRDIRFAGSADLRGNIDGRDLSFASTATLRGTLTGRDVRFDGAADLQGTLSGRDMNFNGATTIGANVSGQELHFNAPLTVRNDVTLSSSSNIFDFNDQVSSAAGVTLSIVPTANTDMFIDLVDGPGHIAADKFGNFKGTLAIGGRFVAASDGDLLNGTLESAPADYITVSESLLTGGNLVLVGSTVDFSKGNDITVGAGAPGEGQIVIMALGDKVQAGNDGLPPDGVPLGNITAPTGGSTVTFRGAQVMLAATNEVQNSTNMIMDLNGGDVLVAQGARTTKTRLDFNVGSRAKGSEEDPTQTPLVTSLTALGAPTNLLQNTRASFPNPAAILTILQAVAFVDSSLFEEDLSLFGVIGDGIAKSLDQCEDAEGCAPSVTEEQLTGLIAGLVQRIAAIEKSMASGETAQAKGETLLSQYRAELASYRDYQTQLHAYLEKQQKDESGSDDFEDVFEAEEKPDATAQPPAEGAEKAAPAEDAPSLEEGSEDLFAPIEDAPAAPPKAAPEAPPADVDEGFETLDETPAPSPAPSASPAPAPAAPAAAPARKDDAPADDFEELEELPDATLLNEVMAPDAVNQIAGLVRLDAQGAVIWSGDVILPTLHRRY